MSVPAASSNIEGIINQDLIDNAVEATKIGDEIGETGFDPNMFLKILMVQLQNQNPFDAVDTNEIVQQQSMMTQVEQTARQTTFLDEIKVALADNFTILNGTLNEIKDAIVDTNTEA